MDIEPVTVYYYQTSSGRCPFRDWFDSLDKTVQQMVDARLTRVRRGLLGHAENLGGGVWELKFDVGPGFRVYCGRVGGSIVILLRAGHKKRQQSDIDSVRECWADYLRRTRE
ncbi:MAG: type II toxin-antitoxin system RelE/ParE family toxin [Elusimicrobiota bacterium]